LKKTRLYFVGLFIMILGASFTGATAVKLWKNTVEGRTYTEGLVIGSAVTIIGVSLMFFARSKGES
jgi:drug/metabolite transporter superfamily protein YnfA